MEKGFDSDKYITLQLAEIKKRIQNFKRTYIEVSGKLFYDEHLSRVLPGYDPENRLRIFNHLKNLGVIYCINAKDIQTKRISKKKEDYVKQAKRDLEEIKKKGFHLEAVVITKLESEKKVKKFEKYLKKKNIRFFVYCKMPNNNTQSKEMINDLKNNEYIFLKRKIILLTGPLGDSGKMDLMTSQIYRELKKGWKINYLKFESSPVWDLPIKHPINLAYEATTADFGDFNVVDELHLKAYDIRAVNHNRDLTNFKILREITGKKNPFGYKSPSDMTVNTISKAITNEKICEAVAIKEITNCYERYLEELKKYKEAKETILRIREIVRKIA